MHRRNLRVDIDFLAKGLEEATAVVLMATPCTKSLRGGSGGHKHGGDEERKLCWQCANVSWSGLGSGQPSVLMLKLMMLERETMAYVKKTAMRHKRGE